MSRAVLSLVAIVLTLAVGCAPGRMADLRDSARLSAGLGFGLSVDAKAGALTHPSFGVVAASAMLGYDSRDVYGEFYEVRTSMPYSIDWDRKEGASWPDAINGTGWRAAFEAHQYHEAIAAIWQPAGQDRPEVMVAEVEGVELDGTIGTGRWFPIPAKGDKEPLLTFNNATDFQVGAILLLFSARAGLNPLEFLDFLLGFVSIDIANDDD